MNTPKHTPSPWYCAKTSGDQGLIISEATGANVAVAYDRKDGPLLASAPIRVIPIKGVGTGYMMTGRLA